MLVTPAKLTLRVGQGAQLSGEIDDASGQPIGGAPLRWTATDERLVMISATGWVRTAGAIGKTTVIASTDGARVEVPVTIEPGSPDALRVLGGDAQTAKVERLLPTAIVLRASDASDNGLANVAVKLTTDEGTVVPDHGITDDKGTITVRWTLGPTVGPQALTAKVVDSTVRAVVNADATATGSSPD
ncbi:MAG: hypothetical protein ABI321_14325 [Polyangia bacterium]